MRKLSVISVIFTMFLFLFAGPAKAEETNIRWIIGEPIEPADVFDQSKMVRTFTYDGVEYEDLSVVTADQNEFKVYWFSDDFIQYLDNRAKRYLDEGAIPPPVYTELVENNKEFFVQRLCTSAWTYPKWDIVSINGEPWQNTIYADVIITEVQEVVKPTELLGNTNSEAWAMFMDPRTNGASHVWFGDPNDPNYPGSGWTKVMDYTVDKITKHNPLNNGKPFDFDSWQWQKSDRNTGSQTEQDQAPAKDIVETFPNPEWQQGAVLVVGNPQVTVINAGVTNMNVLNVPPETVAGRTMIPLRGVLDELGYELDYDGEKQSIILSGQEQNITLTLGKETALVDGREVELDQPAVIKDGRTLVPLRFVSENFGFKVEYDKGKISISK